MQIHVYNTVHVYSCFVIFQWIVQNYVYRYVPASQLQERTGQLLQLYLEKNELHTVHVYTRMICFRNSAISTSAMSFLAWLPRVLNFHNPITQSYPLHNVGCNVTALVEKEGIQYCSTLGNNLLKTSVEMVGLFYTKSIIFPKANSCC